VEAEANLLSSCPLKHYIQLNEVLEIFHFVFGAWRIKELDYFASEAHVLVAVVNVCFEILLRNFIIHKLMVFLQIFSRNYFINDVLDRGRIQHFLKLIDVSVLYLLGAQFRLKI